ncbi:MAG: hypothetical protein JSS04_11830 [Proteobacteria bacterium]|nr:hypothetical protein [Pseudomonadota bacterium]
MKKALILPAADGARLQASLDVALGYPDSGTRTMAYTGALDAGSGNVVMLIDGEGWSHLSTAQQAAAKDITDPAVQAVLSPARPL